jgi:hypothetical protein
MLKYKSLAAILAASFISSVAFANCRAVVQNNSNQPWTIEAETARGNVYFPETSCGKNGPCVVPAHGVLTLEYTYNTGFAVGALNVIDSNRREKILGYYSNNPSICPDIKKIDSSQAVSVNNPSRGGFLILSDTW